MEVQAPASPRARQFTWGDYVLAAINVLLAVFVAVTHTTTTTKLVDFNDFLVFHGEQPFQSRLLPFLLVRAIMLVYPGLPSMAPPFFLFDLCGLLACFIFVWKAANSLGMGRKGLVILFTLLWWQMAFTFVFTSVHHYYWPYDMMSVGFIAAALWMIVSNAPFNRLLVLTVVAMVNRETAILIPLFYLSWHGSQRTPQVRKDFTTLFGICLLVKLAITLKLHAFGETVSFYHVPGIPRWLYNTIFFVTLNPKVQETVNVVAAFGFAYLLLLVPFKSNPRLRNMMLWFIPFFLGMIVVGNLCEIRIYAEFIPLLSLLLAGKLSRQGLGDALSPPPATEANAPTAGAPA